MLKIPVLLCSILLSCAIGQAQTVSDTLPIYKQYPTLPAYELMRPDSTTFFIKKVVQKKRPTVVILFSPTCSHCQHQAEAITGHMKDLEKVNFIFSSKYPMSEIRQFVATYGLDHFPNVQVGQDRYDMMNTFYRLTNYPAMFVYDKKGRLVSDSDANSKVDTLIQLLSTLR